MNVPEKGALLSEEERDHLQEWLKQGYKFYMTATCHGDCFLDGGWVEVSTDLGLGAVNYSQVHIRRMPGFSIKPDDTFVKIGQELPKVPSATYKWLLKRGATFKHELREPWSRYFKGAPIPEECVGDPACYHVLKTTRVAHPNAKSVYRPIKLNIEPPLRQVGRDVI